MAPLDVGLGYGYIVQPDVFVLLNEHLDQVADSRILGAPDLEVCLKAGADTNALGWIVVKVSV